MKNNTVKIDKNKCRHKWVKNGTKNGKQNWICVKCGKSKSNSRKDKTEFAWAVKFIDYILSKNSVKELNGRDRTFRHNTAIFKSVKLPHPKIEKNYNQLIVDAKEMNDELTYYIAHDGEYVVAYLRTKEKENSENWDKFIASLPAPLYVICDGHKGLLKAIKMRFKGTLIQRCQFHVIQNFFQKVGQYPKTEPGKELMKIVLLISKMKTLFRVKIWWCFFKSFYDHFNCYMEHKKLFYKTTESKELGKINSYINSLMRLWRSGDLFRYVIEDRFKVYNTTNKVEGGINNPIGLLVTNHRGIKVEQQATMIELFLLSKSKGYNKKKIAKFLSRKNCH